MAVIYLRSTTGNNANDGLTWAAAKATLAGALAAAGAGGTVYVSKAHAESQATSLTLTSPGTPDSPVLVLCVDDTGDPEPPTAMASTATVTTTGASSIAMYGCFYCYGVTFSAGTGGSGGGFTIAQTAVVDSAMVFDACKLAIGTTALGRTFTIGSNVANPCNVELINTPLQIGAASDYILIGLANLTWRDTPVGFLGATPNRSAFAAASTSGGNVDVAGVGLTAHDYLVDVSYGRGLAYRFRNCKLKAGAAAITGTITGPGAASVFLDNCDSGDTNYRMDHRKYAGSVLEETTILPPIGGASDGTTRICWKMTSLAGACFAFPLASPPIYTWWDSPGSARTVTVEILHDSATALKDNEVWLEVEYLGTSGYPLSVMASDRSADVLATPADQAASTASWTTTGLTNPNAQKLSATFTPQEKGLFRVRIMLAKPSYTIYADPKLKVS